MFLERESRVRALCIVTAMVVAALIPVHANASTVIAPIVNFPAAKKVTPINPITRRKDIVKKKLEATRREAERAKNASIASGSIKRQLVKRK